MQRCKQTAPLIRGWAVLHRNTNAPANSPHDQQSPLKRPAEYFAPPNVRRAMGGANFASDSPRAGAQDHFSVYGFGPMWGGGVKS